MTTAPTCPHMAAAAAATLMGRLKAETAERHRHAESRPLQHAMARGALPRATFAAYLAQLRAVHAALEQHLDAATHTDLNAVDQPLYRHAAHLEADLAAFDHELDAPLPVTAAFIATINQLANDNPIALLGALYVLEGSMNGNRFLAPRLAQTYDRADGIRYLDPYGDEQRAVWSAFRDRVDALTLAPADHDAIMQAAEMTFDAIATISEAIGDHCGIE